MKVSIESNPTETIISQKRSQEDSDQDENPKKKVRKEIEIYPFHLQIQISNSQLRFYHISSHHMVTVQSNMNLEDLNPNDNGKSTPNCRFLEDYDFTGFKFGRPYKWAQDLAGIEYFEPVESFKITKSKESVQSIVEKIKNRKRVAESLSVQYRELETSLFKKRLPARSLPMKVKLEKFQKENGLITFKRNEDIVNVKYTLNEHDYPNIAPKFTIEWIKSIKSFEISSEVQKLCDPKSLEIRNVSNSHFSMEDIEEEVNEYIVQKYKNQDELFIQQILYLMECINVKLEIYEFGSNMTNIKDSEGKEIQIKFCDEPFKGKFKKISFHYFENEGIYK